jgi:hypothetical protein
MSEKEKLLDVLIKQGYSFSFLTTDEIELHQEFVKKNWPNSPTRGNFKYNKWKLGVRDAKSINLLICKKDNKIVGQIGYVPAKVMIDKVAHSCYWGCNFKILDDFKDSGIGAALDIYASTEFPVLLGYNPSPESIKYKKRIGFKYLEGPSTLLFPIKADYLLRLKSPAFLRNAIGLVSFFINPLLKVYTTLKLSAVNAASWENTSDELIIQRIASKQQLLDKPFILHDTNFIKWRCNPPAEFKGKPSLLISSKNDKEYVIYYRSGHIINVYDQYFLSAQAVKSFIKVLCAQEKGATTIKVYANTAGEERIFKKSGFIGLRRKATITAFSAQNLFSNIDSMVMDLYDADGDI